MGSDAFLSTNVRMRGLRTVRDPHAHDIVNVATKITMITNTNHIRKITVARNTETAKRLGIFGITSDAHLREVFILTKKLDIDDHQVVENLICKTLRREVEGTN